MDEADDLLQRALIDAEASAAVALRVGGLAMSEAVTVIFHGRRDLGTIQTYVANGGQRRRRGRRRVASSCACRATSIWPTPPIATRPRSSTRPRPRRSATRSSRADTVLSVWADAAVRASRRWTSTEASH